MKTFNGEYIDKFVEQKVAELKERKAKIKEEKKRNKKRNLSKIKGKRKEYEVEDVLYPYGYIREPDSGIITGCDLRRVIKGKTINSVEVKFRHSGFKTIYKFINQSKVNDVLVIQSAYNERLYILTEDKFLALLEEAGYNDISEKDEGYLIWKNRAERRKSLK